MASKATAVAVPSSSSSSQWRPPQPTAPAILFRSVQGAVKSGLLAYGARAALLFLLKILAVLRRKTTVLDAVKSSLLSVDAARFGSFVGLFVGLYRGSLGLLRHARGNAAHSNALISGAIASVALLADDPERRVTLAHYLFVRALQCIYNALKSRGWWHFWNDRWHHGDALLFILSSAQVMYAYVLRPSTIPASYYHFIRQTGPIDEVVLQNVRKNVRGLPVDVEQLNAYITKKGGTTKRLADAMPKYLPHFVLRPHLDNVFANVAEVFVNTFGKVVPLYLSLTFVPMVLLHFNSVARRPIHSLVRGSLSAARSTTFLAAFCALYMGTITAHRKLLDVGFADIKSDHKLVYWLAGVVASLSIFIERKSRRAELAMYALPRGADSLAAIMEDHGIFRRIRGGELAIFAVTMSIIMHFYENEDDTLSPLLKSILARFVEH